MDSLLFPTLISTLMTRAIPNTLLALLLALKNLETPLSENERNTLVEMGKNLKENPNDQYLIKKKLMAIIKANDTLKVSAQ